MLVRNIVRGAIKNNLFKRCSCNVRNLVNKRNTSTKKNTEKTTVPKSNLLGEIASKYQVFQEEDAEIILDVYEERLKYSNLLEEEEQDDTSPYDGLNLERGQTGVFEIEDLVDVLKRENAMNIFVAKLPKDIKYVDYICVVSGKSQRHMQAISQFVRRIFKMKRLKGDIIPKLEGENSKDWMALDLGNIALHIFSTEARKVYDLESLWAVGSQFDEEYNKPEPVSDMLEMHSFLLNEYQPAP